MEQKIQEKSEAYDEGIVRILSTDIEGKMKIYPGLTKIKGISWSLSNAICNILKLDRKRKISSLSQEEIKKISEHASGQNIPAYLLNRRRDLETGENRHLVTSGLELRKDFDIKRMKKIKSYKGIRHIAGLPVRGQRTRGNFRRNKVKSVGIKKKIKKVK